MNKQTINLIKKIYKKTRMTMKTKTSLQLFYIQDDSIEKKKRNRIIDSFL